MYYSIETTFINLESSIIYQIFPDTPSWIKIKAARIVLKLKNITKANHFLYLYRIIKLSELKTAPGSLKVQSLPRPVQWSGTSKNNDA